MENRLIEMAHIVLNVGKLSMRNSKKQGIGIKAIKSVQYAEQTIFLAMKITVQNVLLKCTLIISEAGKD